MNKAVSNALDMNSDNYDSDDSVYVAWKAAKAARAAEEAEALLPKIAKPSFTEEQLETLIGYVKRMTTLYDLREEDWNENCYETLRIFFNEPEEVVVTVYFDQEVLMCSLGFPTKPIMDLTYFFRDTNFILTPENFHEEVTFGTVDSSIEGSILHIIEHVYAPMFFAVTTWPDSVKSDFCMQLHTFLANLTDFHYKMLGLTVIYIPREGLNMDVDVAAKDKELVKRLEAIVVMWTRQIRVAIGDQDQVSPQELLCPIDEHDFWVYRYENLCGLNYQMKNKSLNHITQILATVQSTYVHTLLNLCEEIEKSLVEAKSNIEYLKILQEPCLAIKAAETPLAIPELVPKVLNLFRFIWLNSPYYNSKERITALCKGLSNEIIIYCKNYVDMEKVFAGYSRAGIEMFNSCVHACTEYKKIYFTLAAGHTSNSSKPWLLDSSAIFTNVEAFIHRCNDMIEVCECMIIFGRLDETTKIPRPRFGGVRGPEFDRTCEKIEVMLKESVAHLHKLSFMILDVQNANWYEEILKFRVRMKEIEVIIENLIIAVFADVVSLEQAIEPLAYFYNYSHRPNLQFIYERKTEVVYEILGETIQQIKKDLVVEKEEFPANLPYFAGRALMVRLKKNRIIGLKEKIDEAVWLWPVATSEDIFLQYKHLVRSMEDIVKEIYRKWMDQLGDDIGARLERSLMCRSTTKPGLLECNIDRSLLEIIREANYWEELGFDISATGQIYRRQYTVKLVYESVLSVVMDYNRIVGSLSDEERILFKQLIMVCDKKILPALTTLTWSADVGDAYINEVSVVMAALQEYLDDYKTCNLEIVKLCEKICDTSLIDITPNYAFDLTELIEHIEDHRETTLKELAKMYRQIIEFLVVIFEGFEAHIAAMGEQWVKFVLRYDALLETALRTCVKNSLQLMYEALHGDGSTGPSPLLKLVVNLKQNQINFEPSVTEVGSLMASILPGLISAIKVIPRIYDTFHLPGSKPTPFHIIMQADEDCQRLQLSLCQEVTYNVTQIQTYKKVWDPFGEIWQVDKDRFMKRYEMQKPSAAAFDDNIGRYTEVANNVSLQETVTPVHFLVVNSAELKRAIVNHCFEWQSRLTDLLLRLTINKIDHVYTYTKTNGEKIMHEPENLDEMQFSIQLYDQLLEEVPIEEAEFPKIIEQMHTLDKYQIELSEESTLRQAQIPTIWHDYLILLDGAEEMISKSKETFKADLLGQAEVFKKDAADLLEWFLANGPFSYEVPPPDALSFLAEVQSQLDTMRAREEKLRRELAIFKISQAENPELQKLEKDFQALDLVWELTEEWNQAWERYKCGEFWTIQTDEMEVTSNTLFRKLTRLSRELKEKGWTIVEHTRNRVDALRRVIPLLTDLKNPAMRDRHWSRVKKAIGHDFDHLSPEFTLEAILEMEMQNFADDINEISNAASMELQIENGLAAIVELWAAMKIDLIPHKDKGIYKLRSIEDASTALEDNVVSLSSMKSTKYVEPFAKEVDWWERTLSYIMECLETTLNVQRQYLYLENIFMGEDIRKQLPKETNDFDMVTSEWKEITSTMYAQANMIKAITYRPPSYLLDKLNKLNDKLEIIQRALEKYLETKRHIFPRFYFISNDDLLEILGNAKNPPAIQPHFKKLFDNLAKVNMKKHQTLGRIDGLGMYAEDGEYLDWLRPVILDGPVEIWLNSIQTAMRLLLREQLKLTKQALRKMLSKRDKWLMTWAGQMCNTSSIIQWTTDCTRALTHCRLLESKKPMKKLRKKQNVILAKLSEVSRRDLQKIQRLKVNALITIEIHARDVIDRMYKANCMDVGSFEWFSQLRFYWDRDLDDCCIRQTNTFFMYTYEYIGNSGRLVITPLTDRCYITLTTAMHFNRGGSPKGPAGTGKTETVKDLGKALGMWVIVNNCSEGLDYKSMGKMFSGLAQSGCWGCFDEFNRINIEVLSVVAQQILCIFSALTQKLKRFVFEGTEICLIPTCGVFITMNPGYAGRTELPDNLKSMFRPISMMTPDNAIIAENLLFSDGFQNTRVLSKKVNTLYQLAMQQLSKQDHYDFGLRSMVALLRYAGRKRRAHPYLPEEQMVYLAMSDMNIAKLTSDDLPLFNGIMSDIFPGTDVPSIDYEEMISALLSVFKEQNIQPIPAAITKVIQLYETKSSRHSVMILGRTGTAKSTTWKALKATMGKLKEREKAGFQNVIELPMNPKSLSQGELYGEFNLATSEWLDGVLSAVMRTACSDPTPEEKWILFDGPVDAVWIENMNSVMDDNKVLTLINSERITMPEQVSLLFEVGDLTVASPATVSRCGMVYHDYKDWGWKPFVNSWISKQRGLDFQEEMRNLFDRYLNTVLEIKKQKCVEIIPVPELNSIVSMTKLLECFATRENGLDPADPEVFQAMSKMWFLFCMIWSVCATVDEDSRKKLDGFIREMEGIFPLKDTIYEYYVDVRSRSLMSWESKLNESWQYTQGIPFFKITVPTIDTVRYDFIMAALLNKGYPSLVAGPVGTGKTSTAMTVLGALNPSKYSVLCLNMSAQTSSNNVQDTIESRLEKRTKIVFVPIGGKNLITFLDDLNMPAKETYGSQPPLELLRFWIDYGFWYDRMKQWRRYVKDMQLMAAMGPPGGGRQSITDRLLSKFNVIYMTFPSEHTIIRIFGTMLKQQLREFDDEIKVVAPTITTASIDIYNNVIVKMLPTPAKMHYLFNLRDISKIFQGLLRSHKDYQSTKPAILRLWIHECFRVFCDRLIDEKDRSWFVEQINNQLGKHFNATFHSLCPSKTSPVFGDFVNPYGIYEDLQNMATLRKYLETQLEEYNVAPGTVRMDIVLFKDAVEHVCRIVRIISQPRGNTLLVGIGGSGRQSLSRLAAYLCDYKTFKIEVTKTYKVFEFKEDLKSLYRSTGVDGKDTSFLFNDTQIADESFLEIVNNMLSSGEVANLYKPDEFEDIKNSLANLAAKAGVMFVNEAMYNYFIQRVRSSLHIVLCMSPIGDAFRNRLRQYPALVNCTTIDWFLEWPTIALLEVANKYLTSVNFVETITGIPRVKRTLSEIIPSQDVLRESVAGTFAIVHSSVAECSRRMLSEMKRYNYVTPTNYLELVAGYKAMLQEKRTDISFAANKLRNGLSKIDDTRAKVEVMSIELEVAQVQISDYQVRCDEVLVVITNKRVEADQETKEVSAKSVKIGVEEVACQKLATQAQNDLNKAMPALEEAMRALDALNKKDITEIRSYAKPPAKVEMVLEAVMILKQVDPTWAAAKKELADNNFLTNLREFDKNNVQEKTLKKIEKYTLNEEFMPDKVGIVSLAAKSLCMWVRAIEKYAKVWKIVAPKKAKLEEAMSSLEEKQAMLASARAKLKSLSDMLDALQREFDEKIQQKEELNKKAEKLKLQLERAALLVDGLAGEKIRWEQTVETLDGEFDNLPGDCLIATAFISYVGPFVSNYRDYLVDLWRKEVIEQMIPFSPTFTVVNFLSDPTTIREWNIQGLPSDAFSTENGIITTRGTRWPLVIDPQCQAVKWIRMMEAGRDLKVVDFGMPDYMRFMEQAVVNGKSILLQNVMETLDPTLTTILNKDLMQVGNKVMIKLNDKMVVYNENFRFFITTKLANPHYAPEISTKTTIVNFAVKEQGLEAQLLGIVVRKEKPILEEQKDNLVITIAKGKRTLKDLENELLRLLYEASGSLLDDVDLITTLKVSKLTSIEVTQSLKISETTEVEIDCAREGYRPCAKRASILFFVLNDMGRIDPMYQFSLDSYVHLFTQSIVGSPKSMDLETRLASLNEYHTYAVYKNTCRALFEHHKLLFSFHMCMKILEGGGKCNTTEYSFLLKGGVVLDRENQMDNPCPGWLSDESWDNITEFDKLPGFHGVIGSFEQFPRDWQQWYINTEPEALPLIGEWEDICSDFQRMLFVRSLRPDRVSFCASAFIVNTLGQRFVEPPVLDIKASMEESMPQSPLIFVLSPGVDPTGALIQLAENMQMSSRFMSLSLGQGQAPIATRLLTSGTKEGHWVYLANCHLSLSWMPKLDKIVENLQTGKVHKRFRLWLSSSPSPEFPISILQAGIKMTTEPPKGLKANLKRLYNVISEDQFGACQATHKYKKLLFALCYFHSVLIERKKFQQLGWNVIYSFNDSDFEISEVLLSLYLDEYPNTPWDALKYLIAGVNYGGHVTDDWDRRLLLTYVNQFITEEVITTNFYRLSSLSTYFIPRDGSLQSYRDYILVLPNMDRPEAFGQHPNADITSLITETRLLTEILLSLQVQASSGGSAGDSKEVKVTQMAKDVLSKIPKPIDYDQTEKNIGQDKKPLDVVLLQEISRYNVLLVSMKHSLEELQKGILGFVVMTTFLEEIFICIDEGRVPPVWLKAYPSLKLLGSWTRDLLLRLEHFAVWAETTKPPLLFWLAAYTFPTGFLTAVLQMAARESEISIDTLSWEFSVFTADENTVVERAAIGVYVRGTYLEGAGWDKKKACLIEPAAMKLVSSMPLIHFKPTESLKKRTRGLYSCPCYYFPIRTGMQGRPAYVVAVDLKSGDEHSDFWVKRGTALLLSLAS